MYLARRLSCLAFTAAFLAITFCAQAQVVVATVPVGVEPGSAMVNSVTNTIYESNWLCTTLPCPGPGTVTVINGATNSVTASVNVGINPGGMAVNPVTNKVYSANFCGNDPTCQSPGTVTVIDGVTLATSTVRVGYAPGAVVVNPLTNKIYVVNLCNSAGFPSCTISGPGTITIIDGATLATQAVTVGWGPVDVAVNTATNTIYVVNNSSFNSPNGTVTVIDGTTLATQSVPIGVIGRGIAVDATHNQIYAISLCGNDLSCESDGTVTVINGATLATQTVATDFFPVFVTVNPSTSTIYVANDCADSSCSTRPTATVINGTTLATTTVPVCSSTGESPADVEVNTVTNQIYIPCVSGQPGMGGHTVTDIDGATNTTIPIAVGDEPNNVGINSVTNMLYVPNSSDATVSVIGGATKAQLVAVTPCRLVDTRQNDDPIPGGTSRSFTVPQLGGCNIPGNAIAYSLNVTVLPEGQLGYLTIWPASQVQPVASTLNSPDGRIKANAAIVPAGVSGAVSVYVTDTTNVILDIDGYFAPSTSQTLQFYSLTPCRVVDTRGGHDGGTLQAGRERDYALAGNCDIPNGAAAYSLNVTVIPAAGGLDYLTVWPAGEPKPVVSTLNDNTGTVVANAAIVPAGSEQMTAFYPNSNNTDLLVDVNGYFAAPGQNGYSFYPTAPCRVIDTRNNNGQPFSGTLNPPVNVVGSPCAPPGTATGYVFNATVVPSPTLGYLTLWPDRETQPVVSTLNAYDGFVTSNMAIVPNLDGSTDAYAFGTTQLILDISGYFAP